METNELINHVLREVWERFCEIENEDRNVTNLIEHSELGKNLFTVLGEVYEDHVTY